MLPKPKRGGGFGYLPDPGGARAERHFIHEDQTSSGLPLPRSRKGSYAHFKSLNEWFHSGTVPLWLQDRRTRQWKALIRAVSDERYLKTGWYLPPEWKK